ncbi:MAG: hypothetical protein IKO30_11365 [Lachnospiraceae bacterium]|nr:hypothetical protein [Lachnospiraceae bacterium]
MSYDILDLLHIDTKEDAYTFILKAFMENAEYRKKSACYWGFEDDEDYKVLRTSIKINCSKSRNKITPDLILYSNRRISVIEAKLFSLEGYHQTDDYRKAQAEIIKTVNKERGDSGSYECNYFYFTLKGVRANCEDFKSIRWHEYYYNTLLGMDFHDEKLNLLCKAISNRAGEYRETLKKLPEKKYTDIVYSKNSWIDPSTLYSEEQFADAWKGYSVYTGNVNGKGHQTLRTDISKEENYIISENGNKYDNIRLFSRIEWYAESIGIYLNWEYTRRDAGVWGEYIKYSDKNVDDSLKAHFGNNKKEWCKYMNTQDLGAIKVCSPQDDMLHVLKIELNVSGKTIKEIINMIKPIIDKYDEYAKDVRRRLIIKDGLYTIKSAE